MDINGWAKYIRENGEIVTAVKCGLNNAKKLTRLAQNSFILNRWVIKKNKCHHSSSYYTRSSEVFELFYKKQ